MNRILIAAAVALGLALPAAAQTPLNDYPDATPVLTDKVWGVDDPAGTWSAKLFEFGAIRALLEANLTTATASTAVTSPVFSTGGPSFGRVWVQEQSSAPGVYFGADGRLAWESTTNANGSGDLELHRDAADTLAQRRGTNPQAVNIYNTFTDAANYERAFFRWSGNNIQIGSEAAGTGNGIRAVDIRINDTSRLTVNAGDIVVHQLLRPSNSGSRDLGASNFQWRDVHLSGAAVANEVRTGDAGELTIATGAVTATGSYHTVDTEGDAASDDLDTINGCTDGHQLVIQAEHTDRTVVAKDGTGNLALAGDFSLDSAEDTLTLMCAGALASWVEIARSDNGT